MKVKPVLLLAMLVLAAHPLLAEEPYSAKVSYLKLDQGGGADLAAKHEEQDSQLAIRKAEFETFARLKISQMNKNHAMSRARMQVRKEADGSYRAIFHEIDDTSLGYEVSRSQSKSIPYVAVLTYREQIYAATGATPDQCRKGPFSPVGFIPNRHIFSYSKGAWN